MIIQPRIRKNICVNAHPIGCLAQVQAQVDFARRRKQIRSPKRVLVIGASNGYGLAARIASAFGSGAATIGLGYERPATPLKLGSAGWYNIQAFAQLARQSGLPAWNINGDAFSDAVKEEVVHAIQAHLGQIDLLIYSIAAPRRLDPDTGEIYSSVIKPIGQPFKAKTVDFLTGVVTEITAKPATQAEITHTVKVMGGEDWLLWIQRLLDAGLLADDFLTLAFSYIGPERTRAIYRDGTMGRAKRDLEEKAVTIQRLIDPLHGKAWISVNKALVTRASAVIPAVPLYISLLYRVMKNKGLHEGCIQQMVRLYRDVLFCGSPPATDEKGRIRLDDWEMRADVQQEIDSLWDEVDAGNVKRLADIRGLREEFLRHHGFGMPGVDYNQDIEPDEF
jgi:enoyl-[acyl-carrier protein] reductase/trans-2-enoyl-CoA reductase (NAD+)